MALEKATITNTVNNLRIPVLFNPEEYTVNRENNFAQTAIPGLSAPILQFVHGNMQTLEMELFVDSYEEHRDARGVVNAPQSDVRVLTQLIAGLMDIDPTTHAPPVVQFTWASLTFTCVLARCSQRFIMFLPTGTPVRARLQVTFNEFRNADMEAKEVKRETANFTKLHVTLQGETLSSIAAASYGDPGLWRVIGMANEIDRPRELGPGLRLVLPNLPWRDPQTGTVQT